MTITGRLVVLALACATACPAGAIADRAAEDSVMGLWATQLDFGPAVRGELALQRRGGTWQATMEGGSVSFPAQGDSIRFALPNDQGGFRGARRGADIEGFWLQPSGETEDRRDPGGTGQRFATPVLLKASGRDRWRGMVRPLEDRFTLYLKIERNERDILIGAFRNPELNSNGGANLFRVFREGDSLWFGVRPDTSSPYERYVSAAIDRSPERIRVFWRDLGQIVDLTRRDPAQAASFNPRAPDDTSATYRQPPDTGDGWTTAPARDVGMDEGALGLLVQRIARGDPVQRRPQLIHSMLVARRGKLVLEEYFFGHDRDTPHDTRSAGKTWARSCSEL